VDKRQINPWSWQERAGFSQAWRLDGVQSLVFLAGQGPISPEGEVVAPGDFEAQARQTFQNLATVLEQAGASFDAVVRTTVYLTDMERLPELARIRGEFLDASRPPASTALGVTALALPGMMIEIDAIAAL
jgi:reactive intermediate/imine deaminase